MSRLSPRNAGEYWLVHGDADLCRECHEFVTAQLGKLFFELAPHARGTERRNAGPFRRDMTGSDPDR